MDRITNHIQESNGCWLWTGFCDKGSPILRVSQPRRMLVSARRYSYETHNGVKVPTQFNVTSTCKQKKCVNPAHLVPMKKGSYKLGFKNFEYCDRDHHFSEWNTGNQVNGKRFCIKCDKDHAKVYAARRRSEIPEHLKSVRLSRRQERQDFVNAIKQKLGCRDCAEHRPVCLDFHHLDPTLKVASISTLATAGRSEATILAEIEKCILICSNCHRFLHHNERTSNLESTVCYPR